MAFIIRRRIGNTHETEAPSSPRKARHLLSKADEARDNRRWSEAAALYGQYLTFCPNDAPIWTQLGHALKESGNLNDAENAYKKSLELAPSIADTQLQLGHLYKRLKFFSNAIGAYQAALRLDNTLLDARRELVNFGVAPNEIGLRAASRNPTMFIDLSDVFSYLHHHPTVSGIQRVQLGIAAAIIAMTTEKRSNISFLSEANDGRGYIIVDDIFITELEKELSRNVVEHARLIEVMHSAINLGRAYKPVAGDTLLLLGAFWVLDNIIERLILLKRKGVYVGTLIHDLIPITHPEFCEKPLIEAFKACVYRVLNLADFVLTQSDHSGRCVHDFITKNNIPPVPVHTLRSAHKTWDAPNHATTLSPAIARLVNDEYVMYVSTIEIRKNHTYLFRIWKRLLENLDQKIPRLVFVGRPGWRVKDLMDQLESTANLSGHIQILHDLTDFELAALYQSALFTVFPSFEEGWGLPVGESLMFGRPCIASNTSSVPEVAGDFADYIDPLNENDGYQKILNFIRDRDFLSQRARYIRERFKPREWHDVASDMIGIVQSVLGSLQIVNKTLVWPTAIPGRMHRLGHQGDASRFIESGDSEFAHTACDVGWARVENFGRWLRDRSAKLEFMTKHGGNGPIVLLLETYTTHWLGPMQLQISVNGSDYPPVKLKPDIRQFLLLHAVAKEGQVVVEFSGVGEITAGSDPRQYLWLGLAAIGYAPSTDILSRMTLLEELLINISNTVTLRPMQSLTNPASNT